MAKNVSFESMSWAYGEADIPLHAQGPSSVQWDGDGTIVIVKIQMKPAAQNRHARKALSCYLWSY